MLNGDTIKKNKFFVRKKGKNLTQRTSSVHNSLPTPFPSWDLPTENELLEIAKLIAKYSRFIHPNIIEEIVKNNEHNRQKWQSYLTDQDINPDLYLWENCSTTYPGIRRHAGTDEIRNVKKQKRDQPLNGEALEIDDNDYPKQLWSFILTGKKFGKKGPTGYQLAHLADHKVYKNRCQKEFTVKVNNPEKAYFGLFTSATNTVYLPASLLRPTDFCRSLRLLLLQKAKSLYGKFCNLLPPAYELPESLPEWVPENFEWSKPVGNLTAVSTFLQQRQEKMDSILKKIA